MELMVKNVFVSSGAFRTSSLKEILECCVKKKISGLELGSNIAFSAEMLTRLERFSEEIGISLLIHNYFPPPQEPFVLNLASSDQDILKQSKEHCIEAINWCARLKVPFYSVHSGFCFHAGPEDLGRELTDLPRVSMEETEDIFVESLKELSQEAAAQGVDLLIENNVLAPFNLVDGKNDLMLGVTSDSLLRMLDQTGQDNVQILLDIAHLKVSAKALGFSAEDFIKDVASCVRAVHLSDNDGGQDTNQPVADDAWFWPAIVDGLPRCEAYILEAYKLSEEEMAQQVELIHDKIKEGSM